MKIRILHTNDIHSRFENFSKIVSKIKELRNENTIILDGGDFNDFMRLELQGTKGEAGCKLLDLANYDGIVVGNNEGFQGEEILEVMAKTNLVPFLSTNLYKNNTNEIEGLKRSIILERGGLRFLIIGATPPLNEFFSLHNMYASNPIEEIRREIKNNNGKYDICILLSHLGIKEDRVIAETIEDIHIIIGGHSHTLMKKVELINNTLIHQSGNYGNYLGILDIDIENKAIKDFQGENIDITNIIEDEEIINQLKIEKDIALQNLSEPLYEVDVDIWHDVIEENPITNLLADGLRDAISCDLSIINSGIVNGGVRKGEVSDKKLLEISPSPLNPTYMEISGKDIKEALRISLQSEICLQDGRGPGFRGRYLGRLHVSGAIIEHDGRDILRVALETGELEDEKIYRVSTSDYLQRGTGYSSLANNKNEKYNQEYTRDTLREYLNKGEFVKNCFTNRWIRIK